MRIILSTFLSCHTVRQHGKLALVPVENVTSVDGVEYQELLLKRSELSRTERASQLRKGWALKHSQDYPHTTMNVRTRMALQYRLVLVWWFLACAQGEFEDSNI